MAVTKKELEFTDGITKSTFRLMRNNELEVLLFRHGDNCETTDLDKTDTLALYKMLHERFGKKV